MGAYLALVAAAGADLAPVHVQVQVKVHERGAGLTPALQFCDVHSHQVTDPLS